MGRGSGMGSWCEIAPPQIITVERCSPRQKTMETILERVAAMGAWLEAAPPQIIPVERSSPRKKTLDTIVEESISMAVDLASEAAEALRPLNRTWESSSSSSSSSSAAAALPQRISPGFVACK